MPSNTDDEESETPFPTLDYGGPPTFSSHLSPDDAFVSPPRRGYSAKGAADSTRPLLRRLGGDHGTGRRRKRAWKKLMWVKQSYPDNYTDQATFLENLQRNPRLKPYDFWPLVADSTVILQHVCSVIIFVVCFACIFQERVSPTSITWCSSITTFVGWLIWERWVSEEQRNEELGASTGTGTGTGTGTSIGSTSTAIGRSGSLSNRRNRAASLRRPILLHTQSMLSSTAPSSVPPSRSTSHDASAASSTSSLTTGEKKLSPQKTASSSLGASPSQEGLQSDMPPFEPVEESPVHQRVGTIKSAALIYSTLLGLSPILKSLTRSTSSDSIWAMSFWLLAINIFFFDYSGGVGVKFPASLSTNAALMASTVLASRLPSTKQVFSITLFSMEVFGLFPVFRRHVRHRSFRYHVILTMLLVLGAGLGVGLVQGEGKGGGWPWKSGITGMFVSLVLSALATGGCSWWLIGLQKYKNEIRGPWDPARPIIMSRTRWDDR